METLFENKFVVIAHDSEKKFNKTVWKPETEDMEIDEWKEVIETIAKFTVQKRNELYLSNDKDLKYIFDVDNQVWMAETIGKSFITAGLKKFAIVRPAEMISDLAAEQTVEEAGKTPFETRFFDNEEDAMKWLFE